MTGGSVVAPKTQGLFFYVYQYVFFLLLFVVLDLAGEARVLRSPRHEPPLPGRAAGPQVGKSYVPGEPCNPTGPTKRVRCSLLLLSRPIVRFANVFCWGGWVSRKCLKDVSV